MPISVFRKNSMSETHLPRAVSNTAYAASESDDFAAAPFNDYFVEKDGVRFAGTHLIVDGGWTAQ